jgi:hypothetical protein
MSTIRANHKVGDQEVSNDTFEHEKDVTRSATENSTPPSTSASIDPDVIEWDGPDDEW